VSAIPIGSPGWPEAALSTASIAKARIAVAISERLASGLGEWAAFAIGSGEFMSGFDRIGSEWQETPWQNAVLPPNRQPRCSPSAAIAEAWAGGDSG
jgi:hypothetical protein